MVLPEQVEHPGRTGGAPFEVRGWGPIVAPERRRTELCEALATGRRRGRGGRRGASGAKLARTYKAPAPVGATADGRPVPATARARFTGGGAIALPVPAVAPAKAGAAASVAKPQASDAGGSQALVMSASPRPTSGSPKVKRAGDAGSATAAEAPRRARPRRPGKAQARRLVVGPGCVTPARRRPGEAALIFSSASDAPPADLPCDLLAGVECALEMLCKPRCGGAPALACALADRGQRAVQRRARTAVSACR